jgi:outer membrane protein, heavy metal efflux system
MLAQAFPSPAASCLSAFKRRRLCRPLDTDYLSAAILIGLSLGVCAPAVLAQQPLTVRPASISQLPEALPAPQAMPAPGSQAAPADLRANALTLVDLEQIALANNPSLGRAAAMVAAARGNWLQVGLPPNLAWGYLGQQLGSGGRAEQHALLVDGELVTGHKLALSREVAAQEVAKAEQQWFAQQQRVLTDVRIAFYEALLAQRRIDLAGQLLTIARQGLTTAERLKRAGETSGIDLLQASLEVEQAEITLNAAQNGHRRAWWSLTAVIGVPQMAPTLLEGSLDALPPEMTWDEALARLLSVSPEVAAAVANVERARWAVSRARAEPIPNVRFQAAVMQDNGIGGKTDGIVQMLLPLPLINRNQGAIRQAESELIAAERSIQQVELDLQNRLAQVFERYASAASQVQRYRARILPAARESFDLVRRGYEGGEFPFLNLLNAQRTYFRTNLDYLDSLRELRSSSAEIEGMLLKNSLGAGQ